jgi:WXG100 family type VII secretion target
MSNPISVDFNHLADLERALAGASAEIEARLDRLRTRVRQLDWDGADRAAYDEAQARWDRAVTDLHANVAAIGRAVSAAAERYDSAEQDTIRAWEQM